MIIVEDFTEKEIKTQKKEMMAFSLARALTIEVETTTREAVVTSKEVAETTTTTITTMITKTKATEAKDKTINKEMEVTAGTE